MCLREAIKQDVIGVVHGVAYFYHSYVRYPVSAILRLFDRI